MEDKISIDRIVNTCNNIDKIQKAILLVGASHSGRTTFAELLKKHRFSNPSQGLIYDEKGIYSLDGIISSKSIKMQTVYPKIYAKNIKDKQQIKIIDVPSIIFTPQNKKWTTQEQRITLEYLIAKNTKIGFLIFVDEKYTRGNINSWKKAIVNFLDLFKEQSLSQELLNSVGLLITKSPGQTKQDIMINRLKLMKSTLQKDKGINQDAIDRLFKNIISENRVFIFKKTTGDDVQKQSILSSWSLIEKISNYTVSRQDFKEIAWSPQAEKGLAEYFKQTVISLEYLAKLTIKLFSLQNLNIEQIKQVKKQQPFPFNKEVQIKEELRKRLSNQKQQTGSKYLNFINNYAELSNQFQDITQDNFQQLIWELTKFKLFWEQQDEKVFQLIFQGLEFRRIIDFKQFDVHSHIINFKEIFTDNIRERVFKKLILAESGNQNKEFYDNSIALMQSSFSKGLPESLKQCEKIFKKKLIKYSNPDEALKIYYQELGKQKNNEKIYELGNDIGLILKNKKKLSEAAKVYKLINNSGEALYCYREAAQKDQKCIGQYTEYLAELYLFEQALRFCYESFSRLGYGSKATITENINQIIQKRNGTKAVKNILIGEIQANLITQVKKITKGVIQTL